MMTSDQGSEEATQIARQSTKPLFQQGTMASPSVFYAATHNFACVFNDKPYADEMLQRSNCEL
jgi:hypothetical protein